MTSRNAGGRKGIAVVAGVSLALLFAVSLAGLARSPVTPQSVIGQVLALANETGSTVAGIQIVFAPGSVLSTGWFSASSGAKLGQILSCGGCLWIRADVADGGVLRLAPRDGLAEAFVKAYWYADARSFLNALRRSANCSIL
jgi:hypothetical protein